MEKFQPLQKFISLCLVFKYLTDCNGFIFLLFSMSKYNRIRYTVSDTRYPVMWPLKAATIVQVLVKSQYYCHEGLYYSYYPNYIVSLEGSS